MTVKVRVREGCYSDVLHVPEVYIKYSYHLQVMTVNLFSCFILLNYYNISKLLHNYLLIISSFVKHDWFTSRLIAL